MPGGLFPCILIMSSVIDGGWGYRDEIGRPALGRARPLESNGHLVLFLYKSPNSCRGKEPESLCCKVGRM